MRNRTKRTLLYTPAVVGLLLVLVAWRHWAVQVALPDAAVRTVIEYVMEAQYDTLTRAVTDGSPTAPLPKWADLQKRAFLIRTIVAKPAGPDFMVQIRLHGLRGSDSLRAGTRYVRIAMDRDEPERWSVTGQLTPAEFYIGVLLSR